MNEKQFNVYLGVFAAACVVITACALWLAMQPREVKLEQPAKPLPECWKLDMDGREFRFSGAWARMNGYEAEARMWFDLADETEAKPCTGERWEGPEQ